MKTVPLVSALAAVCALAGCSGESAAPPTTVPAVTTTTALAAPARACAPGLLPAGFTLDAARSKALEPADYSGSGDMQAAMIYDQYRRGARTVYTNLHPTAGGDPNLVIECTVLQFATSADASRFIAAFKALREQAGNLAQTVAPPSVAGATTLAYLEHQQGFAGYGITSTDVLEVAAQTGSQFATVSIAGPQPSAVLAARLLAVLAAS